MVLSPFTFHLSSLSAQDIEYTLNSRKTYEIASIEVEGAETYDDFVLIGFSGLAVGDKIEVPGDQITKAVKRFWKQGLFSSVKIKAKKIEGNKIWLVIALEQRPRVSEVKYEGLKKSEREDVEVKVGIRQGSQMTPNLEDHAKTVIKKYLAEKGFHNSEVNVIQRTDPDHPSYVRVLIAVDKKAKTKVGKIYITGNKATAYGFIAAAEKAGLRLYLGSYPITPATDVLHELSKHKSLGVITVQCEDEISGAASALGASFAGALAVTSTSGPGVCLKSEAMNLAVIMELPMVILDVQRGGPATGLPTKSEQTDLLQVLFGRNGESPMPVLAATSPADCFDAAYQASKIALEHMTPVVLLTDAYIANGSGAFKLPEMAKLDTIVPPYVPEELKGKWTPYMRAENGTRYWAVPGREGFTHILGGLEKDAQTGAISTNPENHDLMTRLRQQKIANIEVPDLEVEGDVQDADLLIVGFGSTYGHLHSAMDELKQKGYKVAQAQFKYLNPLPKNDAEVLMRYKKVVVAEQNMGQLAAYLRMKVDGFVPKQFNQVKGQPFVVEELVNAFENILKK